MRLSFNAQKMSGSSKTPRFGHSEEPVHQFLDSIAPAPLEIEAVLARSKARLATSLEQEAQAVQTKKALEDKFAKHVDSVRPEDIVDFNQTQLLFEGPKLILGTALNPQKKFDRYVLTHLTALNSLLSQLKIAARIPSDAAAYVGPVSLLPITPKRLRPLVMSTDPKELLKVQLSSMTPEQQKKVFKLRLESELALLQKGSGAWVQDNFDVLPTDERKSVITKARRIWLRSLLMQDESRIHNLRANIPFYSQLEDQTQVPAIKLMGSSSARPFEVVARMAQALNRNKADTIEAQKLLQSGMGAPIDGFIPINPANVLTHENRFNVSALIDATQEAMRPKKMFFEG
jgi:hypothetical protein